MKPATLFGRKQVQRQPDQSAKKSILSGIFQNAKNRRHVHIYRYIVGLKKTRKKPEINKKPMSVFSACKKELLQYIGQ